MKYIVDLPDTVPPNLIPVLTALATSDGKNTQMYFHIADNLLEGLRGLPPERRVADIKIICSTLQDSLLQFTRSN